VWGSGISIRPVLCGKQDLPSSGESLFLSSPFKDHNLHLHHELAQLRQLLEEGGREEEEGRKVYLKSTLSSPLVIPRIGCLGRRPCFTEEV